MVDYKKIIYDNYVNNHNKNLYGENSLEKIEGNFSGWQYHFGSHLPSRNDGYILDMGCGDGNFVYWLHSLGYNNTHGIDISAQQIESGKRMGIPNLTCVDIIDFLSNNKIKYNTIIARDVIEHFTKDAVFKIFMLIKANLEDGGQFIMQVPNGEGYFYTSIFYGDYTHEMAYTSRSVNQIALNTGFSKSSCFSIAPVPNGLKGVSRSFLWRLKEMQLRFWKMVETGDRNGIFTRNLIAVIKK